MAINQIFITGRLCADPVMSFTPNGLCRVSFRLASNFKQEATFIYVNVWDKLAEIVSQYTKKGDKVAVSGRLTCYKDTKDIERHSITASNIEFMSNTQKTQTGTKYSIDDVNAMNATLNTKEDPNAPTADELPF